MIESLYFSCYYAFLLGDLEKTRTYFDILKDEFKGAGLKEHQLKELTNIRNALREGIIARKTWTESSDGFRSGDEKSDIKQEELVKKIHGQISQLENILGEKVRLYNIEHPCPPYGKVDMVYMGKNTVYPIEVKVGQGKHDLIGQIGKYDLYHKLHLHLKQYEFVQSVTICQSYDGYTINEIKGMGIIPLMYTTEPLSFRKV